MVRLALCVSTLAAAVDARRLAVIGGGIGGGSFAHYWSKAHPGDGIIVFESRDYLGGRLKHVDMHGHIVEIGGDAWSTAVNQYVVGLDKEYAKPSDLARGRPKVNLRDPVNSSLGVWQGDHVEPLIPLVVGMPVSDLRAAADELGFIRDLRENYRRRGDAGTFETVEDFLATASLDRYTQDTAQRYFSRWSPLSDRHINPKLLQFALEPLTRVIYDQNLSESHAFASLVAVTAAVGADQFAPGNSVLVERMFKASGADVRLNTTVSAVTFDTANGSYEVRYCHSVSGQCSAAIVDAVVVACPVEHSNIAFSPEVHFGAREWREWYVTVSRARGLNPRFFGLNPDLQVPFDNVLTTENSSGTVPFSVLQKEADLDDGTSLWKFFSNADLTSTLSDIFVGLSTDPADTVVQHWPYTFPVLKPLKVGGGDKYQPIVLGPRLLHLNTLESVASAMEGSVIAARNAALLLAQQFKGEAAYV